MKSHHPFQRSLLALSIASLLCTPALANELHEHELDDVVIYGNTERNTATKTQLAPQETPQSISVIDQNTLSMRNADSVAAALRYTPGVNTELRGGAVTRLDLFNVRGFINYQNAYDGLQLLYNDWNLQPQIDLLAVEQVEVFKGPTSTLYGNMPPGGMVNLISKKPGKDPYNSVQLAIGSQDLRELSIESRGQLGDSNLSYSIVGLARSKDGQAQTSEEERIMLAPSLDWQVTDATLVNFNLYYQKDPDMGIYTTLPASGLFLRNSNGKLDPDTYSGDANWNTFDREVLMPGYKISHQFNDNWSFLHNTRFLDADVLQKNTYSTALAADERTLGRRAYLTDERSKGVTMDNQLSGLVRTGVVEHNLLLGLDYLDLDSRIRYEDALAPDIDLFNPNHHLIDPGSLDFAASGYSSKFDLSKRQTGLYFQDQMRLGRLVVIAGVRRDHFKGSEKGVKYGFATNDSFKQNKTTYRAGMLYGFDNGLAPFVSYAESFEPMNGSDRNGRKFEPSNGQQWEAGIKYAAPDRRTSGSLAVYRITKDNVQTRDPNGGPYDLIQAGEVRSQGVELELASQVTDSLHLSGAWTVQDVEVTKDNSGLKGTTPVWIPEQQVALWANYELYNGPLAGTSLGLGWRYIGEAELNERNTGGKVPSARLVDLSVGYDLSELDTSLAGASIRLSVNNLLDERYYSCYDENNCWFGAERTVQASLKYEF